MLQEDDALAAETAGEEDEDGAGGEGGAWAGGFDGFADLHEEEVCQRGLEWVRPGVVYRISVQESERWEGLLAPEYPPRWPLRWQNPGFCTLGATQRLGSHTFLGLLSSSAG